MYYQIISVTSLLLYTGQSKVADVALSRATLEAQVASKPSVVAALKKYNRYVHFCKGQPYPAFPPSYTSVADFLLTLIRERGGSTRSIANDKSHIKQQCELHGFGWLDHFQQQVGWCSFGVHPGWDCEVPACRIIHK